MRSEVIYYPQDMFPLVAQKRSPSIPPASTKEVFFCICCFVVLRAGRVSGASEESRGILSW